MKIQDFKIGDWEYENSSGYQGYRNKITKDWIYIEEYNDLIQPLTKYNDDYSLLHNFRRDCLPFGEYPDIILREFLDKKYNLK